MVSGLQKKGHNINKISKTKSIMYWLLEMKEKQICIVLNSMSNYAKVEQENYTFKEVNGIAINQPIDKHNHFWDASRYGFMALNQGGFGFY